MRRRRGGLLESGRHKRPLPRRPSGGEMTDPGAVRPKRSVFALVRQLVSGVVGLAKLELEHGRQEMGVMLSRAKGGVVLLLIAFVLLFGALIAAVMALILGLAALTGWAAWVMALIVVLGLIALAGFLGWRGARRIKIGPPEETIASVKEEVAWAKRLIGRE